MFFNRLPVLLAVAAALGLAACQPLPQPFQPEQTRKSANPLLDMPDRSGIVVKPVVGLPADTASALAAALAEALTERSLPAFTQEGNKASQVLTGEASIASRADGASGIRIAWRLTSADGATVGEHVEAASATPGAWAAGDPETMRGFAARSAQAIAALVRDPPPVDRVFTAAKRSMHVWPIQGAPERAGALLREEMETALRQKGLRVSSKLEDGAVVLTGTVSVEPGETGYRTLSLDWTIMRNDGGELGTLRQENPVKTQDLEEQWPRIAKAIADGAAAGVKDLLDKLPARALEDARRPKK